MLGTKDAGQERHFDLPPKRWTPRLCRKRGGYSGGFKLGRTHVAEIGMPTPAIVEHFDVFEDRRLRLPARLEVTAMHELLLKRAEETFNYRNLPTVPLTAQAAGDSGGRHYSSYSTAQPRYGELPSNCEPNAAMNSMSMRTVGFTGSGGNGSGATSVIVALPATVSSL